MPAYNEGACIFDNIRATRKVMLDAGISAEIVVVDDGSSDNTLAEIHRAAETYNNVIEVKNAYNMGKGMALRNGFERSSGEIVAFLDADLDLHPSQILNLTEMLESNPCDVVVSSKYHPDSQLQYPFSRTVASWGYYLFIKTLFKLPVRDTQTGLKVFRRKVLDDVLHRLLVKKFAYDVELLAAAVRFGYKVAEAPAVLEFKRDLKWGRIRFEDVMSLFIDTVAVFYRLRIMKYYDGDRPQSARTTKKTLIVFREKSPPERVIARLADETNIATACYSNDSEAIDKTNVGMALTDDNRFIRWLEKQADYFEIIGVLGRDCLPLGSWINYSLRNFDDPSVAVVCGPTVPGSFPSRFEKASGLVFSSMLTRGTEAHLYSFRRVKNIDSGLKDNFLMRAELLRKKTTGQTGLHTVGRFVRATVKHENIMRYDPDAAVMKKVPPLFLPYIKMIVAEAFADGVAASGKKGNYRGMFPLVLSAIWLFIVSGWTIVPLHGYMASVFVYSALIILGTMSCLSPTVFPLFLAGIVCNHIVRAVVFPAGILMGIIYRLRH